MLRLLEADIGSVIGRVGFLQHWADQVEKPHQGSWDKNGSCSVRVSTPVRRRQVAASGAYGKTFAVADRIQSLPFHAIDHAAERIGGFFDRRAHRSRCLLEQRGLADSLRNRLPVRLQTGLRLQHTPSAILAEKPQAVGGTRRVQSVFIEKTQRRPGLCRCGGKRVQIR